MQDDWWILKALAGTFGLTALVLLPVTLIGAYTQQQHDVELRAADCHLVSELPTGNRKYCGKACWRDEIARTYACRDGRRIEID